MTNTPSNYGYAVGGRALRVCLRCGCLVGDTDLHDTHHESLTAVALCLMESDEVRSANE